MATYFMREDFEAIGRRAGVREVAFEDAWMLFSDYEGSAAQFFKEHKEDRPHWYAANEVTDHAALYSLDEQAKYFREHGEAATRELLASFELKLGQVKPKPKAEVTGSNNPYADDFKGTPEEREARIASLIKSGGPLAASLARSAGKTLTGQKIVPGQRFIDPRAAMK
jgi:hypothetical protein